MTPRTPSPMLSGKWSVLSGAALRALADKINPPARPKAIYVTGALLAQLDDILQCEPYQSIALNYTRTAVVYSGAAHFVLGLDKVRYLQARGLLGPEGDYSLTPFARRILTAGDVDVWRRPASQAQGGPSGAVS